MIPLKDCKPGYLYLINARNSRLGIYTGQNGAFTISRYKFDDNYLFDEYHHDNGPPYGTVQPYKELMRAPEFIQEPCTCKPTEYRCCYSCRKVDRKKLAWLNYMAEVYYEEILDAFCPPTRQEEIRKNTCPKCHQYPGPDVTCPLDRECIRQYVARFEPRDGLKPQNQTP